ncbi:MAG: class I SAM-dependent DNA methyltransferase [Bacteroidales bacterium]|nr:class I SAM-dependent DNA methyltransferase [Bacteroidales bacterium]
MSKMKQKQQAVKAFIKQWSGKGYEKGETQSFWHSLLHNVLGIEDPTQIIEYEMQVKTLTKEKGSDFIDAFILPTKILIEQKSSDKSLSDKFKQSDDSFLTPYQQARRYAEGLPFSEKPRWIVCCNFSSFEVHDMEHPNDEPQVIYLKDLDKEYYRLDFLVKEENLHLQREEVISLQAGQIVGALYEKLVSQYNNPDNPESQKSLNKLCVRLVFCLYAEDAGVFGNKNMFHDYLSKFSASEFRGKLIQLFRILDTKPEDRDQYEDEDLLAFPYVNGGMFSGDIEIPRITEEIRSLILQRASNDFDWSLISPTIFGAVFESTLNPDTRRSGGMHYTSIKNIHKVIDPLFLSDLETELEQIKQIKIDKTRKQKASDYQQKLSKLKFLDPACGSGNFLTESFTCLRRLENEALKIIYGKDRVIGELVNPIKVSINQFYGIEINDFACSVAQTALWIAESQMMQETEEIVGFDLDPLPLKTNINIKEGNALRLDWSEWEIPEINPSIFAHHANIYPTFEEKRLLAEPTAKYKTVDVYSGHIEIRQKPKSKTYHVDFDYIMGNPPFLGYSLQNKSQKDDILSIFKDKNGKTYKTAGKIDYVSGWFYIVSKLISGTKIKAALVSTNSITQGEQVASVWKPLVELFGIRAVKQDVHG